MNMNPRTSRQQFPARRKLLGLMAMAPWLSGSAGAARADDLLRRFRGIGVVLVVDAVPGAEMKGLIIYNDFGYQIYGKARASARNRDISALGGARVPLTVRATWREGAGWDKVKKVWNEGTIVGDYTIPVAERIPDEVLNDIRAHGGSLRLKFRLKPDGVMFGWDIERDGSGTGHPLRYDLPGGDFLETRY